MSGPQSSSRASRGSRAEGGTDEPLKEGAYLMTPMKPVIPYTQLKPTLSHNPQQQDPITSVNDGNKGLYHLVNYMYISIFPSRSAVSDIQKSHFLRLPNTNIYCFLVLVLLSQVYPWRSFFLPYYGPACCKVQR